MALIPSPAMAGSIEAAALATGAVALGIVTCAMAALAVMPRPDGAPVAAAAPAAVRAVAPVLM